MSLVTVKVDDASFQEWLKIVENRFVYMIKTMKNVAEVVREHTLPLTPFETGKLGRSYRYHVLTDNSRMKVIQVEMTALNEHTGYDYAWIQHENSSYHHPSLESMKKNPKYLDIAVGNILGGIGGTNNPTDHYLLEGIRMSMDDAILIIEDDYLSLFNGGII